MIDYDYLPLADLIPGEIYKAGTQGSHYADDPIKETFKLYDNENNKKYRGIGNSGGIRRTMIEGTKQLKKEEAFVVLVNNKKNKDWPNYYDSESKILRYYGDNDKANRNPLETNQHGNKALKKFFERSYGLQKGSLAPFFYFERTGKSDYKFIGVAIPYVEGNPFEKSLQLISFSNDQGTYENYVALFTVIECKVKRRWLYDLKTGNKATANTPVLWLKFIKDYDLTTTQDNITMDIVLERTHIGYSTKAYRKTQHIFRSKLLSRHSRCQLCQLDISSLLIASHIVPWALSDDAQKADVNNGLLLCVLHDALFDKNIITFDQLGNVVISKSIPTAYYRHLSISNNMNIVLTDEQKDYMSIRNFILEQNYYEGEK